MPPSQLRPAVVPRKDTVSDSYYHYSLNTAILALTARNKPAPGTLNQSQGTRRASGGSGIANTTIGYGLNHASTPIAGYGPSYAYDSSLRLPEPIPPESKKIASDHYPVLLLCKSVPSTSAENATSVGEMFGHETLS